VGEGSLPDKGVDEDTNYMVLHARPFHAVMEGPAPVATARLRGHPGTCLVHGPASGMNMIPITATPYPGLGPPGWAGTRQLAGSVGMMTLSLNGHICCLISFQPCICVALISRLLHRLMSAPSDRQDGKASLPAPVTDASEPWFFSVRLCGRAAAPSGEESPGTTGQGAG